VVVFIVTLGRCIILGGMGYDIVLKSGTVIDGTGAPARRADVAISRGTT